MKQKFGILTRYGLSNPLVSSSDEECIANKPQKTGIKKWKKFLVVAVVLMSFSPDLFAQFEWGLKLGANASTQSEIGNICDDNDLRAGFNSGFIFRVKMNDWLALNSGLNYQLKGKKCHISGEDSKLDYKLNYLVLPAKAEFSASEKAGFANGQRIIFATGPYLGYLLDANQIINGETTRLDNLNDFDFGWLFEIGFEFPVLKSNALQVTLNYDMGLREWGDENDGQNKTASLNLGFLF